MAKNEKNGAIKQAINKELRRIRQFVNRAKKRGYVFPENIIPQKPKNPTKKTLARYISLTPEKLYQKAKYIRPSGEVVSGKRGRELERIQTAKKAAQTRKARAKQGVGKSKGVTVPKNLPRATDVVLQNVLGELSRWTPLTSWTDFFKGVKEHDKNVLDRMVHGAISSEGKDVVAARLEAHAVEVNELLNEILYGSGGGDAKEGGTGRSQINLDLVRFSAILMGRALTKQESIDLTDLSESEFEVD